jgi:hypothetical protein
MDNGLRFRFDCDTSRCQIIASALKHRDFRVSLTQERRSFFTCVKQDDGAHLMLAMS